MDESDTNSSSSSSCDEFDDLDYKIVSGVRAFSAFISLVSCLIVIILIFLFKRHHYFIQRLVLYMCFMAAINSVTIMIQKVDYFTPDTNQRDALDKYCIFAGFAEYYTSAVELIGFVCITHGLYRTVFKQKPKKYLELGYICISLLFPLLPACAPFFGFMYGKSGPWCWIRERSDNCDKETVGIIFQFVLWYIPLVLLTVSTSIVYIAMFCKVHKSIESHWQGPYDPELFLHKGRLRKVVKILLAYMPILFLLINLMSLPNAIQWAIGEKPILALWILHGVFPPFRGALFAIPYLFHTDTRQQIKQIGIRGAVRERFMRKKTVTSYPAKECNFSDSLTFPAAADTTYERNKPYRNPSLRQQELSQRYSIPTIPQVATLSENTTSTSISTYSTDLGTHSSLSGLLTSRNAADTHSECESRNQQNE
uniref:Uncharacterized protein n=1 Tax=Amphimedon queenslandica TaxID=400682 RepID=A0A1X7UNV4_AMPQE